MNFPQINPDQTFTPTEAGTVVKEYVCAVCYADLAIQHIPSNERVFVMCPEHGSVCVSGRVLRATVSIRAEQSHRNYFTNLSHFHDLFGSLWRGVAREEAERIAHDYVCALCGDDILMHVIMDQGGRVNPNFVTLKCRSRHEGFGMVRKSEYEFIPPVAVRVITMVRAAESITPTTYTKAPAGRSFDKLGVVTVGDDFFNIIHFAKDSKVQSKIKSSFGEKPKELTLRLVPSKQMSTLECYNRGGLVARAVIEDGLPHWNYYRDPYTMDIEIRGGTPRTIRGMRFKDEHIRAGMEIYRDHQGKPVSLRETLHLRFILPNIVNIDGVANVGYYEMSIKDENASAVREGVDNAKKEGLARGYMLSDIALQLSIENNKVSLKTKES